MFIVCMDTDGRLCDQMESETFSQSDDKPGSGFLPQVAHLYVKLANLLVMFERCLIINNRWKAMSFNGCASIIII